MRTASTALAVLLVASTAHATPILTATGDWLPVPTPCECGAAFYDNPSADGAGHGIGHILESLGFSTGLEYLSSPGTFTLTEWSGTKIHGETAYSHATIDEYHGVLTYDDRVGPLFSSNAPSGGVAGFALFRTPIGPAVYRILVGVNDTWAGDRDYQDSLYQMDGVSVPVVCVVNCGGHPPDHETPGVPEPMSLLLFGLAAIGCSQHFRRR